MLSGLYYNVASAFVSLTRVRSNNGSSVCENDEENGLAEICPHNNHFIVIPFDKVRLDVTVSLVSGSAALKQEVVVYWRRRGSVSVFLLHYLHCLYICDMSNILRLSSVVRFTMILRINPRGKITQWVLLPLTGRGGELLY